MSDVKQCKHFNPSGSGITEAGYAKMDEYKDKCWWCEIERLRAALEKARYRIQVAQNYHSEPVGPFVFKVLEQAQFDIGVELGLTMAREEGK